jgi:hypothetical protein
MFRAAGMGQTDAEDVATKIAKCHDLFVDHHMLLELGLLKPTGYEEPAKYGTVDSSQSCTQIRMCFTNRCIVFARLNFHFIDHGWVPPFRVSLCNDCRTARATQLFASFFAPSQRSFSLLIDPRYVQILVFQDTRETAAGVVEPAISERRAWHVLGGNGRKCCKPLMRCPTLLR